MVAARQAVLIARRVNETFAGRLNFEELCDTTVVNEHANLSTQQTPLK